MKTIKTLSGIVLVCMSMTVVACGGSTQTNTVVQNSPGAADVGFSKKCKHYHYVVGPDGKRHRQPCNRPVPTPGPAPNPVPVPSPGGGALGPAIGPVVDHHVNPACGTEYWDQKTLTDGQAADINSTPKVSTVSQLASTAPPSKTAKQAGFNHPPRFGADLQVWQVPVTLIAFKQEQDGDIHLKVGDGQKTLIAELPTASCVTHSNQTAQSEINTARATFLKACGNQNAAAANSSGFTSLSGNAVIQGPGFFDKNHGQNGVADVGSGWGIEIHPVTGFSTSGCQQASGAAPPPGAD